MDINYWNWIEGDQYDEDGDLTLYGTLVPPPASIYVFDPKTGLSTQVTHLPESGEYDPTWSPNGKLIAHIVVGIGYERLYITDVATSISSPLLGAEGGNNPAWSPNGQWIAFDRTVWDDPNLYVISANGGTKRLVRESAITPAWSPSGTRLVFVDPADGKIKTISSSGDKERLVTDVGANPAWSPSGEWIAFARDGDIWKVRVNSMGEAINAPVQVTSGQGNAGHPTWSADSRWIVFHNASGADSDLWQVKATGSVPVKLITGSNGGVFSPAYSWNGRYIAYFGVEMSNNLSSMIKRPHTNVAPGLIPRIDYRITHRPNNALHTGLNQRYVTPLQGGTIILTP